MTCDDGRLILTSSHKYTNIKKKQSFLDMNLLKTDQIFINNITSVCENHIKRILQANTSIMACNCNLFHRPSHITANADYRDILNAFLVSSSSQSDLEDDTSKTHILAESGVLPAGLTPQNVHKTCDLSVARLSNFAGYSRFCTNHYPVNEVLSHKNNRYQGEISKTVVVYIDPALTSAGQSLNGMSFVTRHDRLCQQSSKIYYRYILLAVEEFSTSWLCPDTQDISYALAECFIATCNVITKLYEGYFNKYIIFAECNSINLGRFWSLCKELFAQNLILKNSNIVILSSVTALASQVITQDTRMRSAKRKALVEVKKIKKRVNEYENTLSHTLDDTGKTECTFDEMAYNFAVNDLRCHNDVISDHTNMDQYRIGYVLGADKLNNVLHFFYKIYNAYEDSHMSLCCSTQIWSYFLINQRLPVPTYIGKKLQQLELRPHTNKGKYGYKVTGKKQLHNQFVCDDLAIAIVMSVVLCENVLNGTHEGDFTKIEN